MADNNMPKNDGVILPKELSYNDQVAMMKSLSYLERFIDNLPGGETYWKDPEGETHTTGDVSYGIDFIRSIMGYIRNNIGSETDDIMRCWHLVGGTNVMQLQVKPSELRKEYDKWAKGETRPDFITTLQHVLVRNFAAATSITRSLSGDIPTFRGQEAAEMIMFYSCTVMVLPPLDKMEQFSYEMRVPPLENIMGRVYFDATTKFDYTRIKITPEEFHAAITPSFIVSVDLDFYFREMKSLLASECRNTDICLNDIMTDISHKIINTNYNKGAQVWTFSLKEE